jgi:hypothetical protein
MSDPPGSFPSVPYVRELKGNGKIATRRSGNAARSLRSLRCAGGTHVCARVAPSPYILLSERRERSERVGVQAVPSCGFLVHFALKAEVNEVNEVVADV